MKFSEIILVLVYTALFSFIILKWKFFRSFNLSAKFITIIFLCKVGVGILYGYLHLHLYQGGDTYAYFNESGIVFSTLKNNPWLYLRLVFWISYPNPAPDIVPYKDIMWFYTTPDSYFLVRFHSLVRLVSFGYYNVHVVFYNFLTTIGILYLFLFFEKIIPQKKHLLISVIFFFPSIIFWSSGIHKDGISLAALGLILYFINEIAFGKISHGRSIKNFVALLIGCWLLLLVRNYWLLLLIPAIIAFIWTINFPKHTALKFLLIFVVYLGVAINLRLMNPRWDFLKLVATKQSEFFSIAPGSQTLALQPLTPSLKSVAAEIPGAIMHCLLRPSFGESNGLLQFYAAFENILVILLLLIAIFFRKKKLSISEKSLLWFCFFFAFTIFILIGIIVPILGALVRYKMAGVLLILIAEVILIKDEIANNVVFASKFLK